MGRGELTWLLHDTTPYTTVNMIFLVCQQMPIWKTLYWALMDRGSLLATCHTHRLQHEGLCILQLLLLKVYGHVNTIKQDHCVIYQISFAWRYRKFTNNAHWIRRQWEGVFLSQKLKLSYRYWIDISKRRTLVPIQAYHKARKSFFKATWNNFY